MKSERQSWFSRVVESGLRGSLWLVSAGLCLASSGLDGAYLTRLMPPSLFWLGYVLNTMADVASEIMMYWFGRLRLLPKASKHNRLALLVLPAEALLVGYAWFFSWRQLLLVLPRVESADAVRWVAPIAAGFIPLALLAVGYTQALLAGRAEDTQPSAKSAESGAESARPARLHKATRDDWREIYAGLDGNRANLDAISVNLALSRRGFVAVPDSTARDWAREARESAQSSPQVVGDAAQEKEKW